MLRLFVDPYVLASPANISSADEIDVFVEHLLRIRDLRAESRVGVYVMRNTLEVLERADSYPVGDRIQRFRHQQRKDVADVLRGLLNGATVEDSTLVDDVLVEEPSCAPDIHVCSRDEGLAYEYHRLHAIIDLARDGAPQPVANPCVLTRGLASDRVVISAEGQIPVCIRKSECIDQRRAYQVQVLNLNDIAGLCHLLDPVEEWKAGRHELALRVSVARARGGWLFEEQGWTFGAEFLESASRYGFLHEEPKVRRLIAACTDAVQRTNLRQVHPLRTGAGANDPQRVRASDSASAWRRDVNYEFHLHYWTTPSSMEVEMAAVVSHNTFTIPE